MITKATRRRRLRSRINDTMRNTHWNGEKYAHLNREQATKLHMSRRPKRIYIKLKST